MLCLLYIRSGFIETKNNDMTTLNKVLLAAAIAAAAGAVLGILFAPEKGSDLRKRISSKAKEMSEDVLDEAKESFVTIKERLTKKAELLS
jgi:gas vesicle protein